MSDVHVDQQFLILTERDRAVDASWIGVLGLIGPVRRRTRLVYRATCPACLAHGALTLRITVGGEICTCTACSLLEVRVALVALRDRTHFGAAHLAGADDSAAAGRAAAEEPGSPSSLGPDLVSDGGSPLPIDEQEAA